MKNIKENLVKYVIFQTALRIGDCLHRPTRVVFSTRFVYTHTLPRRCLTLEFLSDRLLKRIYILLV